jgi:tetratricopeptide (TPR) repeat protein
LFARLAVFGGSFSIEAAEVVVDADLDGLASLVDKSLLRETGQGRFFMLETLKEFAAERLEASGEAHAFRSRHADWMLELAEGAEPHLEGRADQGMWLDTLDSERANLRTASATLRQLGRGGDALRLVTALWRLWFMRGPLSEGTHLLETALEEAPSAAEAERARGLWVLGNLHHAAGNWDGAAALHAQALELSRRIGDERGEALALLGVGVAASARGELELAKEHVGAGLRLARQVGDMRMVASATSHLGVLALHERDYFTARACFEESLPAMGGEEFGTVVNLSNLAFVAFRLGDLPEAAAKLRECLPLMLRLRDHLSMTHILEVLAAALAAQGDLQLAAGILGASAGLREDEGISLEELEAELHDETEALLRTRLGADDFERELAAGREAELEDLSGTAIARLGGQ